MPTRLETIRALAHTDPYWRGYLDGLTDKHAALGPAEAREDAQQPR